MIRRDRRARLKNEEVHKDPARAAPVVIWAVDETEEEAFARAGIDLRDPPDGVVVIKRFCQTVAEDRRQRGLED